MLLDLQDARDLDQFLTRAAGVREGVARLIARGSVAALHVAAAFPLMLGAPAPVFIAQRGVRLAVPAELDVVVPMAELRDRLARLARSESTSASGAGSGAEPAAGHAVQLDVPPSRPSAPWTSLVPLGAHWEAAGAVSDDAWVAAARGVASRVQAALPQDPGQPVVFAARDAVWNSPEDSLGEGVISGAPFLAHAYGFLTPGGSSALFTAGAWRRLSARGGTLLWRAGA